MTATADIELYEAESRPLLPEFEAMLKAFSKFLLTDVAEGEATADTIRGYHAELRYFVEWCGHTGVDPARLTKRQFIDYRADLRIRGLAPNTRQRKISVVRRFYDAAVAHNLLPSNPCAGVKAGKDLTPPEEKIRVLSESAVEALFALVAGDDLKARRDRAIIGLMLVHGLRRVEVHRLDHENLDFGEAPRITVTGKGNKIRNIYLREDTARALHLYLEAKDRKNFPNTGAVFVSHSNPTRGGRIARSSLNWLIDHYLRLAGVKAPGVSCHGLRHTHATQALEGGADLKYLQSEMGHASHDTTLLYVRLRERATKNPAQFIKPGLVFEESGTA